MEHPELYKKNRYFTVKGEKYVILVAEANGFTFEREDKNTLIFSHPKLHRELIIGFPNSVGIFALTLYDQGVSDGITKKQNEIKRVLGIGLTHFGI